MINRRPYVAESAVKPGCAVVQGSADNNVRAPSKGARNFIGIYPFEANEEKKAGEGIGIVLHGVVKALAGDKVAAGTPAVMADDSSGALIMMPNAAGRHQTVGTFLESGYPGDYVDFFVERGSVTI